MGGWAGGWAGGRVGAFSASRSILLSHITPNFELNYAQNTSY